MIKIDKLDKFYNKGKANEVHVINETDLVLDDTGLVCILGESGSGKTTLMNTISGLDDFKSGSIEIDGEVITKFGQEAQERIRNEKFGYIFQNYYLLMDQTVEYNIMLALSLYDISEEDKVKRVEYVLDAVDMMRYRKRLVSQLSGGQQQRVAIARALAKTPKVIFADEPTGNLDENNTIKIMSILKQLSKTCLVVLVTHERSIADLFADRIINISDGKIISDKMVEKNASYEFSDDTNIYLGEFEQKDYSNDNIEISAYSNEEMPKVTFKIIYTNNKVYLYPEGNVNIEVLTESNEKKVLEGKKPVVELEDVEMDYELETITSSKIPKLKFKDMWNMAKENIVLMGKKQIFLILSFIVMAILMVLTVQDVLSVLNVDEKSIVSIDSHVIGIEINEKAPLDEEVFDEYFATYLEIVRNMDDVTIMPTISPYITYEYNAFWQLAKIKETFQNYSVVPIDILNEETIILGRMPKNYNEIVVDKRVLENYIGNKTAISNIVSNIEHFLNKDLLLGKSEEPYTVVGICESDENSIYMDKFAILSMSKITEQMNSLSALNVISNGEYSDFQLAEDEVLLSETQFNSKLDTYLNNNYSRYYGMQSQFDRTHRWYWWEDTSEEDFEKRLEELWIEYVAEVEAEKKDEYGMTYEEYLEMVEHPEDIEFVIETAYNTEYKVVGMFSDEYNVNMIVADSAYEQINIDIIDRTKSFDIYCENKEAALEYLEKEALSKLSDEFLEAVNIIVTDTHTEEIKAYDKVMQENFDGRIVVTASIFVVSMVILYFMMKSNAVSKITDIGVYRLLGISKKSIIGLFALESFMITTYTSLITVILTTIVTKFLGNIPSLGMTIVYPWYAFVGTIVFIYAANVIIGVMPVVRLLKLPPAALAAKYDI